MGTPEQKAHRKDYANKIQKAWDAGQYGNWKNDQELRAYLDSQGIKGDPIYNQLFSGGGYNTYGPSWQPGWNYDFNTGEKIPYQGEGESWYDPSKPENWQSMGPIERERMNSWFNWRDQNQTEADSKFGGNTLAYWFSQHPKNTAQANLSGNPLYGISGGGGGGRSAKTGFWDWLYSKPGENIKSLMGDTAGPGDFPGVDFGPLTADKTPGSLSDVKGFDPKAWDKAFNPAAAGLATAPTVPITSLGGTKPTPTMTPPPQPVGDTLRNPTRQPPVPLESPSSITPAFRPVSQFRKPGQQPKTSPYRSLFGQGASWNPGL